MSEELTPEEIRNIDAWWDHNQTPEGKLKQVRILEGLAGPKYVPPTPQIAQVEMPPPYDPKTIELAMVDYNHRRRLQADNPDRWKVHAHGVRFAAEKIERELGITVAEVFGKDSSGIAAQKLKTDNPRAYAGLKQEAQSQGLIT